MIKNGNGARDKRIENKACGIIITVGGLVSTSDGIENKNKTKLELSSNGKLIQ